MGIAFRVVSQTRADRNGRVAQRPRTAVASRATMNSYGYQVMPGAIGLELQFGFLAGGNATSTSWLTRKYNTFVEIDGYAYEREGGVWHVFPVQPGLHFVRVFFRTRPSMLSRDHGEQRIQVMVPPGGIARLRYTGGAFWPLADGTLCQTA